MKSSNTKKRANAAVRRSIVNGETFGEYIGTPPVYYNKAKTGELPHYIKVAKGVPFVKRERYV